MVLATMDCRGDMLMLIHASTSADSRAYYTDPWKIRGMQIYVNKCIVMPQQFNIHRMLSLQLSTLIVLRAYCYAVVRRL